MLFQSVVAGKGSGGTYPFTVTATDSASNAQSQSYTIVISGS